MTGGQIHKKIVQNSKINKYLPITYPFYFSSHAILTELTNQLYLFCYSTNDLFLFFSRAACYDFQIIQY